ncbi:MAG: hypothetical protein HOZ81_31905 [Streptomyces sp.]|nr:hypothetical protein [Streptomyces sp.]NUT31265.1 hypothetical protein [Streptomyces sp.]
MRLLNHRVAGKVLHGAAIAASLAAMAGCSAAPEDEPPAASTVTPLPSQVGKGLPAAIDTAVKAHYGYGLSEATGRGQLQRVTAQDWKVCFQKPGPLSDSVIFGVVRTQEQCPDRWIDKLTD